MSNPGPIARSFIACISIGIFVALVIAGGANAALVLGAIMLLGGFGSMGDGRRDKLSGIGAMALGAFFLVVGFAMK
jgi:hypothetical protein